MHGSHRHMTRKQHRKFLSKRPDYFTSYPTFFGRIGSSAGSSLHCLPRANGINFIYFLGSFLEKSGNNFIFLSYPVAMGTGHNSPISEFAFSSPVLS